MYKHTHTGRAPSHLNPHPGRGQHLHSYAPSGLDYAAPRKAHRFDAHENDASPPPSPHADSFHRADAHGHAHAHDFDVAHDEYSTDDDDPGSNPNAEHSLGFVRHPRRGSFSAAHFVPESAASSHGLAETLVHVSGHTLAAFLYTDNHHEEFVLYFMHDEHREVGVGIPVGHGTTLLHVSRHPGEGFRGFRVESPLAHDPSLDTEGIVRASLLELNRLTQSDGSELQFDSYMSTYDVDMPLDARHMQQLATWIRGCAAGQRIADDARDQTHASTRAKISARYLENGPGEPPHGKHHAPAHDSMHTVPGGAPCTRCGGHVLGADQKIMPFFKEKGKKMLNRLATHIASKTKSRDPSPETPRAKPETPRATPETPRAKPEKHPAKAAEKRKSADKKKAKGKSVAQGEFGVDMRPCYDYRAARAHEYRSYPAPAPCPPCPPSQPCMPCPPCPPCPPSQPCMPCPPCPPSQPCMPCPPCPPCPPSQPCMPCPPCPPGQPWCEYAGRAYECDPYHPTARVFDGDPYYAVPRARDDSMYYAPREYGYGGFY